MSQLIAWVCKWILSISLPLGAAEPNIYRVYYIISCRQETVWERWTWGGEMAGSAQGSMMQIRSTRALLIRGSITDLGS